MNRKRHTKCQPRLSKGTIGFLVVANVRAFFCEHDFSELCNCTKIAGHHLKLGLFAYELPLTFQCIAVCLLHDYGDDLLW